MFGVARLLLTAGFLGMNIFLAATDYAVMHDTFALPQGAPSPIVQEQGDTASSAPTGVAPQEGAPVADVIAAVGLTQSDAREDSVLREIIPPERAVEMRILLKDGDRIAFLAWTDSPDVKTYFTALKEALQSSFSSEVHDVIDRTEDRNGKPTRNVLGFTDPAIHEERLIFVRVRQRLYEFHVAPGKENEVNGLMEALTE